MFKVRALLLFTWNNKIKKKRKEEEKSKKGTKNGKLYMDWQK
jgi:hypothetical protein